MKSIQGLISVVFVGFVVIFGVMYVTSSMVAMDNSVNVIGTEYEETYESVTDTSIATLSLLNILPWIIGAVGLIIAVMWLKQSAGRGGW